MSANDRVTPAVNGFLNFYKPVGITSMEALRRVKRITRQRKKVGHAGTMDPLAEGVLPICFGQATRLMEQVVSGRKRYVMEVRLGASSTTYDAEGDITTVADPTGISRHQIEQELQQFIGVIDQVPPMYSALKVDGQRLYDLARAGKVVERRPRQVEIHTITIDTLDLARLCLTIDCGRGTYMRSVANDLGAALGCGGYVTALARVYCGGFSAPESITLDGLEAAGDDWQALIHPVDWALRDLPTLTLSHLEAQAVRNGQAVFSSVKHGDGPDGEQRRAYDPEGLFLALVQYQSDRRLWQPTRVFQNHEPSPYAVPTT